MREEYGYSFKSAIENSQITEVNEGNHANFSGKWQLTASLLGVVGSGGDCGSLGSLWLTYWGSCYTVQFIVGQNKTHLWIRFGPRPFSL